MVKYSSDDSFPPPVRQPIPHSSGTGTAAQERGWESHDGDQFRRRPGAAGGRRAVGAPGAGRARGAGGHGRLGQPGRAGGRVRPAQPHPAPAGRPPRPPGAPPARRYSLGSRLVPLGANAHALLGERVLPVLRDLAELTGESANFAVLTQGRAEYAAQAPGRHTMRIFSEVGNRVELHCTGVGKALLAAVPQAQAERLMDGMELTARTPARIT